MVLPVASGTFLTFMLASTQLNTQGCPEALQSSLSEQLSPFWYFALKILATLYSQLCHLNSERHSGCGWVLSPCTADWKLCPGSKLVIRAHLIRLMFLGDHCPLLPHVLCLESHCCIYFVLFLVVSGRSVNSVSVILSLSEAKFLS